MSRAIKHILLQSRKWTKTSRQRTILVLKFKDKRASANLRMTDVRARVGPNNFYILFPEFSAPRGITKLETFPEVIRLTTTTPLE